MQVRPERTGWRDEALSRRHRDWGFDIPAVDVDFLLVEYDHGVPKAIIEYKHECAAPAFASGASYRALAKLGNMASLPFFVCRYKEDFSEFKVVPLNVHAIKKLEDRQAMNELEYVTFLYMLRGREIPDDVAGICRTAA